MIFALRARPPCTITAALFAGTKGVLVLIYAKNVQLLVYHTTFLPFVNGKVEEFVPFPRAGRGRRFAARECAPIFFGSCPKKTAAPGQKKSASADKWPSAICPQYGSGANRY